MPTLLSLQTQYKNERNQYNDELRLRVHRALSWLAQADAEKKHLDNKFIHLWIAFNAAYARNYGTSGDRTGVNNYLADICQLDQEGEIYTALWQTFSGSIRVLLNNPYCFQPFWEFHSGNYTENAWKEDFETAKQKALNGLMTKDTRLIMVTVFDRLYTLRNQIVHGGATFNSKANRSQLSDSCNILSTLIPIILQIMMDNPNENWGKPFYPYISQD